MSNENIGGRIVVDQLLLPRAQAAAAAFSLLSEVIDTARLGNSSLLKIFTGALTGGGTATINAKLQHSDTAGGTFTDIVADELQLAAFPPLVTTVSTGASQYTHVRHTRANRKRFLRVAFDVALVTATAVGLAATITSDTTVGPGHA